MYAAGRGISNRLVGTTRKQKKKKTKEKDQKSALTLRQRLYVPCMWSSCLSCCFGSLIMFGGMVMSFMGYYAEFFATSIQTVTVNNTVHQTLHINSALKFHIQNFMYIGPLLMGVGTFLAIVACVIVLETRDKVLDMMEAKMWKNKKADFYDLICLEMKRKEIEEFQGELNRRGALLIYSIRARVFKAYACKINTHTC